MLSSLRFAAPRASLRSFSTTSRNELAKLTLIGRLGGEPQLRMGKNDKEYVTYNVATTNTPTVDSNGERQFTTSWHRIYSFGEGANKHLLSLKSGSKVYVEAAFELRESESSDSSAPQAQRIFLRHETIKMVSPPRPPSEDSSA